jgi:hypothetical protein
MIDHEKGEKTITQDYRLLHSAIALNRKNSKDKKDKFTPFKGFKTILTDQEGSLHDKLLIGVKKSDTKAERYLFIDLLTGKLLFT